MILLWIPYLEIARCFIKLQKQRTEDQVGGGQGLIVVSAVSGASSSEIVVVE